MFCPNCTTDNIAGANFCVKCGSALPGAGWPVSADPQIGMTTGRFATGALRAVEAPAEEPSETADASSVRLPDEITDALVWPPHIVFEPGGDEAEPGAATETEPAAEVEEFEDAQAEDDFERSFTGLVIPREPESEIRDEPDPPKSVAAEEPDPPAPLLPVETAAEPIAGPVAPEIEIPETKDNASGGSRFFRSMAVLVLTLAAFGTGVGTGAWLFESPALQPVVPPIEVPVNVPPPRIVGPPGMEFVPGGEFMMGSDTGDPYSRPAHKVAVGAFFMDITEVTNGEYRRFVEATGYDPPGHWIDGLFPDGQENFPVTGVNWYDAAAYAAWAGKRLPTEAEWEFAARGTDGRIYPWGDEWRSGAANAGEGAAGLREVGSGEPSPFGMLDMSGNAWEWTASNARAYPDGKPIARSRLRLKIIRGGNWQSESGKASAIFRGFYGASGEREYNGTSFRCVKDVVQ